ncbi:hypothetical protein [Algoriphagus winogradskyi]|uniref:6-bladed beta-propeller protein n=1 Tax=Algoriphagus winogradskyi TaxID=237017 RepID=A0ABY1NXF7_9BACT|nr:hypothetical protein [Algoriphagus winogradskyi]SMP21262.1 hypothetical protein SAMN06265367_103262 [Algoriphagus winogradskyi]
MKIFLIKTSLFFCATFLSSTLSAQEYTFKKVKEIRVESLAEVGIRDYDPKRDIYLGFIDKRSEGVELAVFDGNGKILNSQKRDGEGPEDYLSSALAMGFSPDGNVFVQTSLELVKYDTQFIRLSKVRFEPKTTIVVYSGPRSKFVPLTRGNDVSFIVNGTNLNNRGFNDVPKKMDMIEYYNAGSQTIQSVIPLSSRKVFEGIEDEVFPVSINPIFIIDSKNSNLYFTTSIDNEITVYNPINWNVIQRIPVKHEFFKALEDIPLKEANLGLSNKSPLFSRNQKILKFDSELLGLIYVKEISEAANELRKSEGKTFWMNDPEFQRVILFKNGVQLPGELTIPSGLIEMTLPNNRVLVKVVNQKEELDYYPYEIWELVEQ